MVISRRTVRRAAREGIEPVVLGTIPVLFMSLVGHAAVATGVVHLWYGAPSVAMVAVVTSWWGRETGLVTAVLSMAMQNLWFVPPANAFSIPTCAEMTIYVSMMLAVLLVQVRIIPMQVHSGRMLARGYKKGRSLFICNKDGRPVYEVRDL